jgi:hypothetical protein
VPPKKKLIKKAFRENMLLFTDKPFKVVGRETGEKDPQQNKKLLCNLNFTGYNSFNVSLSLMLASLPLSSKNDGL